MPDASNRTIVTGEATAKGQVDDLRQRLRSLGYLDAGVDRFVLGSARRSQTPVALALFASVRIGILAAVLLGPAAATGLAVRLPGLVTGGQDAAVAALYFGILFGALISSAAFVTALMIAWATRRIQKTDPRFDRRNRQMSFTGGVFVTASCLAYLTLWWRTADAGLGSSSPVWTAFALLVATAISLLLGHAVRVTALALTVASPGRDLPSSHIRPTSWKTLLVGGAIAFTGATALLLSTAGVQSGRKQAPVPLTVASSGARVLVLAIDGFDDQLYLRFRRGAAAASRSSVFTVLDAARAELAPSDSGDPARIWTTVATGVRPETHGVDGLETRRVAGLEGRVGSGSTGRMLGAATDLLRLTRPATASNFERRVKTFWEVAEQAGLRTGVVNWWATWPATASAGRVISDRAVLRLERGGPLDAELAPPELYDALRGRWPEIRTNARARARDYFSRGEAADAATLPAHLEDILTRSAELDATTMQLAENVASDRELDLLVVYLPGLDIAQHTLLGDGAALSPSQLDTRIAALQRYYTFLSSLPSAGPASELQDRRVFVVTQPGRLHNGPGIMAAAGTGLRAGTRVTATVLDVAPTILHALGVPISNGLDGRVVTDLFESTWLAHSPVRYVDTYGLRGAIAAARGSAPLDQEMIDRLRSLGYVR